jgi:hypothetical protein
VYFNIAIWLFGSFGLQLLSKKSISFSQLLTSVYEAWSYLLNVLTLSPFDTWWTISVKVICAKSVWLLVAFCPCTLSNLLPVIYCLTFPSALPPEPCSHNS